MILKNDFFFCEFKYEDFFNIWDEEHTRVVLDERVWLKSQAGASKGNGIALGFFFSADLKKDHQFALVDLAGGGN